MSSMKFLSTWLRNAGLEVRHAGFDFSSMKFLSTWLRNSCTIRGRRRTCLLNEVPEHMAQEYTQPSIRHNRRLFLNEVPEHMAQE